MGINDLTTAIIRCVIYVRISLDKLGDERGVINQLADLKKRPRRAAGPWSPSCRITTSGSPARTHPAW